MRTFLIPLLLAGLTAGAVHAEQGRPRTITVYGDAATTVTPDQVVWRLNVMARDQKLDAATSKVTGIVAEAQEIAKTFELEEENVQIGRVSVGMRYETKDGRETGKLNYYEVSQGLTVVQKDLGRYDELRVALTAVPGLQVDQNFRAAGADSLREVMRLDALRDAMRKAAALAEIAGAKLGPALSISEFKPETSRGDGVEGAAYMMNLSPAMGRPEGLDIRARIYAVFEME